MCSSTAVQIVTCHARGRVGDVIIGGAAPPPCETLREQPRFFARDGAVRAVALNEPRGGGSCHVNLQLPPRHPEARMGFLVMEFEDTWPMETSP